MLAHECPTLPCAIWPIANGSSRTSITRSSAPRSNSAAALPASSENSGALRNTPRMLSTAAATTETATLPPASEE